MSDIVEDEKDKKIREHIEAIKAAMDPLVKGMIKNEDNEVICVVCAQMAARLFSMAILSYPGKEETIGTFVDSWISSVYGSMGQTPPKKSEIIVASSLN